MKKYIIGFFVGIAFILGGIFIFFQMTPTASKMTKEAPNIQSNAIKLINGDILIFIRSYFMNNKEDILTPRLIVIDNNSNILSHKIPIEIIISKRLILGYSKKRDKIWIFSPYYDGWIEYNLKNRKFVYHNKQNNSRPKIEDSIIILDSQQVGDN